MYRLFGLRQVLTAYAVLACVLGALFFLFGRLVFGTDPPTGPDLLTALWIGLGRGTTVAAFLFWLLGETALFPRLCRIWPLNRAFPDLDGTWEGSLESNWPQIASRLPGAQPGAPSAPVDVPVQVSIKARLSSVSVALRSASRYSRSETIFVGVERRAASDALKLTYVYENRTAHAEVTDEQFHLGAGVIELDDRGGTPVLEGVYWTNRNWHQGLNTAGEIHLSRVQDGATSRSAERG